MLLTNGIVARVILQPPSLNKGKIENLFTEINCLIVDLRHKEDSSKIISVLTVAAGKTVSETVEMSTVHL